MKTTKTTKICTKCNLEKDLNTDNFYFNKDRNNYIAQCRECVSKRKKIYSSKPEVKQHQTEGRKLYYENNKEKENKQSQKYYVNHIDDVSRKRKIYNAKLENKIKRQQRYQADKASGYFQLPEIREKNRKSKLGYYGKRGSIDLAWRLSRCVSSSIKRMLKINGFSKGGKSIKKYLGENYIELLKAHLETLFSHLDNLTPDGKIWMSWNNWGIYNAQTWDDNDPLTWTWQLDRIIPHSIFHYTTMECQEFRDCWVLSNLRPLNAKQNNIEGSNRMRHNKNK